MATQYLTTGTRGRKHTLPNVASDTICLIGATQTLVGKTLTSPTLTSPTITGGTTTTRMNIAAQTTEGAITIARKIVVLTHADAGAYTLAAPSALQDGMEMVFTAGVAAAHVITATGLLKDGTTGTHNTATFAAYLGASLRLVAYSQLWHVTDNNLCTIA